MLAPPKTYIITTTSLILIRRSMIYTIYLGPAGTPTSVATTEEGIIEVSRIGLNAMELEFVRGVNIKLDRAKKIGDLAKEKNVKLSCHAPYFINLNSKEIEKIKASQTRIKQTIEAANAAGAGVVVVHAGFYSGKNSQEATEAIIKNLSPCIEYIEKIGADVKIGIETMGKQSTFGTQDEILQVCNAYKLVIQVVDFSHIHARYGGSLKTGKDFENVLSKFEKTNPKYLHSHFTGIKYGAKGELHHLTIESREPDFEILAPILKKKKYDDITVISESPILEQDSLVMKKMLEI